MRFTAFTLLILLLFSSIALGADTAAETAEEDGGMLYTDMLWHDLENDVIRFLEFRVDNDGYAVRGASGSYSESTRLLIAAGDERQKASLSKTGDDGFAIEATDAIVINFDLESLRGEGGVIYRSDEMVARSQRLLVDRRQALVDVMAELLAALPPNYRPVAEEFFAKVDPEKRLILLIGDVDVERESSSLTAAWVAFVEGSEDEFISAGGDAPVRLTL